MSIPVTLSALDQGILDILRAYVDGERRNPDGDVVQLGPEPGLVPRGLLDVELGARDPKVPYGVTDVTRALSRLISAGLVAVKRLALPQSNFAVGLPGGGEIRYEHFPARGKEPARSQTSLDGTLELGFTKSWRGGETEPCYCITERGREALARASQPGHEPERVGSTSSEPEARHSPDFRSVFWFGQQYSFTATQARIVQELWRAWENGTPGVSGEHLLETSESLSARVADVFKHHPAWGTMIQPGKSKGTYRLAPLGPTD